MIKTNSPAMAGTKYVSAAEATGVGAEVEAAAGSLNIMWVCAVEVKYELDPANVAVIAYVPGMLGLKL